MSSRAVGAMFALAGIVAAAGCGGKPADSPGACPAGTVLQGSDCVPDDSSSGGESTPSKGGGGGEDTEAAGGKSSYDKEAVDVELKRAARQVKGSCGSATDDSGQATGPWGPTKVSVVLGRNGHIKQVTVPSPYDGKPVGVCIVHAFQKIQFPPYGGGTDVVVDWDVETTQPKK